VQEVARALERGWQRLDVEDTSEIRAERRDAAQIDGGLRRLGSSRRGGTRRVGRCRRTLGGGRRPRTDRTRVSGSGCCRGRWRSGPAASCRLPRQLHEHAHQEETGTRGASEREQLRPSMTGHRRIAPRLFRLVRALERTECDVDLVQPVGEDEVGGEQPLPVPHVRARAAIHLLEVVEDGRRGVDRVLRFGSAGMRLEGGEGIPRGAEQRLDAANPEVLTLPDRDIAGLRVPDIEQRAGGRSHARLEPVCRSGSRTALLLLGPQDGGRAGDRPDEQHEEKHSKRAARHAILPQCMSGSYYNRLIVKVVAIINPISGAGADDRVARRRVALLGDALDRRGLRAAIHLTAHRGHARALADAAVQEGAGLVLVWGGDGTVNEAGAALVGTPVALGLVPAGSGNGLAAALRAPREPRAAIAAALDGVSRAIDVGLLAGHPFFNIGGVGIDARIAARFNRRAQGSRGQWPYIRLGIREAWRYAACDYELELDGVSRAVRALLIGFANGLEYGNGVRLSSRAALDDGLLHAVVVHDRPVPVRFWDARRLVRAAIDTAPGVFTQDVRHARVHRAGKIEFHVDGEPGVTTGSVEVSIRPRALLVRVAKTPADTAAGSGR
jgi:diacylglycerol kinase (ATP)